MQNETLSLLIGGHAHSNWERYRIDSDLLIPADAWEVGLGAAGKTLPDYVVEGAAVQVMLGSDIILSGLIDEIDEPVSMEERSIYMSGRDYGSVLTDCSGPIFTAQQVSLSDVIAKIVSPLGISKVRIQASVTVGFEKVSVDPGESAWDVLARAAEASGLWPWFDPDGTLVVGGPDYSSPVVADLIMNYSGIGNNVESIGRRRSIAGRYSEVTVLGQSNGTALNAGQHAIMAKVVDPSVGVYRPRIVIDSESENRDIATKRAKKLVSDSRLEGLDLAVTVYGHRIADGGALWTPGQRVHVRSEPHGIDDIYFLMGRAFERSVSGGTLTHLRLKEDGIWAVDAFPDSRRKKVKGAKRPLQIMEVSTQ